MTYRSGAVAKVKPHALKVVRSLTIEEAEERLLTKSELGSFLGVSVKTIDRWVSERTIPFLKVGSLVRFSKKRVLQDLEVHGGSYDRIS